MSVNSYSYDEIHLGMQATFSKVVTQEYVDAFREQTGDINPLHRDVEFAKSKGYDNIVAFGMLTASYLSTLAGVYLPGERSIIHSVEMKFLKPVYINDTLTVKGTVKEKNDLFRFIVVGAEITNQHGQKVSKAKINIGVINE